MQPNIVVAMIHPVERVQSTNCGVSLEDADLLIVIGQSDPGGEPRHSRSDNDRVVHVGCDHRLLEAWDDEKSKNSA